MAFHLIVDNTIPTPILLRPFDWGAGYCRAFGDEVHRRARATVLAGVIVDSGKFNWDNGKFPQITAPDPSYHGLNFREAFGDMAYIIKVRAQLFTRLGTCHLAVQRLPVFAGAGDAASAHGAAQPKRAASRPVAQRTPEGRVG
jgi:O-acetylhomoserine/O-acetylserine sulfhydrylase-like pyridoxal-dependent enzyme